MSLTLSLSLTIQEQEEDEETEEGNIVIAGPLEKQPKPFRFKSLGVEAEEEVADVEAPQWHENDNAGARSLGT